MPLGLLAVGSAWAHALRRADHGRRWKADPVAAVISELEDACAGPHRAHRGAHPRRLARQPG